MRKPKRIPVDMTCYEFNREYPVGTQLVFNNRPVLIRTRAYERCGNNLVRIVGRSGGVLISDLITK